ncbi:MAG: oligosaccharide flippase family protein [Acidobacteriota bacterium]|nr:oligosaccharide flippase family protein [Acidobacteriota bacterium]
MSVSLKIQSIWLFLAKFVSFLLAFALPLLVVRYLSREEIGTYRQVFLVVANASSILPFGFPMTALYFLPREPESKNQLIQNILLFNFLVGGCFFLSFFLFSDLPAKALANDQIKDLATLIGLTVWLWTFSTLLETFAIANQETRIATLFIVFSQLTKTSLMILAVILFSSIESLLYAAIIQGFLQILALIIYLKRNLSFSWEKPRFSFIRRHLEYAIPLGFTGLIWILQNDLHNYFVSYRFGAEDFAIYAYGCFQIPLIMILRESVASVLIPKMSKLQAVDDKEEMIRVTVRSMQKLSLFYFPTYVFLFTTSDIFIKTLFTEKFDASIPIFLVNITLLPFEILLTDPIVRAYKELGRLLLRIRILSLIVLVSALYFAIWHVDLTGVITIAVSLVILEKLLFTAILAKKLGFNTKHLKLLMPVAKTAFSCLIAGFFLFIFITYTKGVLYGFFSKIFLPFLAGSFYLLLCLLIFGIAITISGSKLGIFNEEKEFLKQAFEQVNSVLRYGKQQ